MIRTPRVATNAARWQRALSHRGRPAASWIVAAIVLTAAAISAAVVALAGPEVTILIAISVVAVRVAYAMPGFLFAAYLLIPFYKGAIQPYLPVDITVILAAANALQLIPVVLDGRARRISRLGVSLWLGLGGLVLAGTLYAPNQALALSAAASFWVLVLTPVLAAGLRVGSDFRYIRQLLWAFFGLGVVTVVLGLIQLSASDRLVVLGMNTIQVSVAALLVPLIGATFVLLDGGSAVRLATLALIPAAVVVAVASGSRGPMLIIVALAAIPAERPLLPRRTINPRLIVAIGGAVVATIVTLVLAGALLPSLSLQRFTLLGDFVGGVLSGDPLSSSGDTSAGARVSLFGLAVSMFTDRPLTGVGTAGFEALSPEYGYPHNAVLQFAAEFGLIGVGVFIGLVVLAYRRRLSPGGASSSLRAVFLFLLLNSMLSGNILEDRMMWGLLVLILVAEVDVSTTRPVIAGAPADGRRLAVSAWSLP